MNYIKDNLLEVTLGVLWEEAKHLSRLCQTKKKHVSFIVGPEGDVLSWGINKHEAPESLVLPCGGSYRSTHSEWDAATKCKPWHWDEDESLTLVNFRVNNQGALRNSRPCPLCMEWVTRWFDDRIYWSEDHGMVRMARFTDSVGEDR